MPNPLGQRESAAIPKLKANLIWKHEPRYDSFLCTGTVLAGPVLSFFSVGQGAIGSGFGAVAKTVVETNLTTGGKIGDPNQFLLYGFSFSVLPNVGVGAVDTLASDTALIYNGAVFSFFLGSQVQLEVPLTKIPTGCGPTGFATNYTAGTPLHESVMTNGVPDSSEYYKFTVPGSKLPLLIDGSQTFRVEVTYPVLALTTLTTTRLRCYMHGVYGQAK